MKIELALVLSSLLTTSLPASLALANDGENETPDLLGPITRADLESPQYPWMKKGETKAKADYAKRTEAVKKIGTNLAETEIEIYLATWCSDSHDHVPSLVALLDETKRRAKAEPKSVKFYGLSKRKTYEGYTNPRNIERLPTFVFFRGGKEIGRIVETPTKSILEDTVAILSAK